MRRKFENINVVGMGAVVERELLGIFCKVPLRSPRKSPV